MTQRIITAALSMAVCAMPILAFLKRYSDEERPKKRVCYDCGLYYASDRWIEAVVPDDVWEIINPTYHRGAGLLCIQCMASRCIEAGLKDVPVMFTSGPFVMNEDLEPKPGLVRVGWPARPPDGACAGLGGVLDVRAALLRVVAALRAVRGA